MLRKLLLVRTFQSTLSRPFLGASTNASVCVWFVVIVKSFRVCVCVCDTHSHVRTCTSTHKHIHTLKTKTCAGVREYCACVLHVVIKINEMRGVAFLFDRNSWCCFSLAYSLSLSLCIRYMCDVIILHLPILSSGAQSSSATRQPMLRGYFDGEKYL